MTYVWIFVIVVLLVCFALGLLSMQYYYKKQLKKEVKRAQKSEQLKSAFIDNVCHTLRTPLNAILGYSNMILEEYDDTMQAEHIKDMSSKIKKNSKD